MSEAYDRRDTTALLADLGQMLKAPRTEPNLYQALHLQASLIALLLGQVASLQMQVDLLTKTHVVK